MTQVPADAVGFLATVAPFSTDSEVARSAATRLTIRYFQSGDSIGSYPNDPWDLAIVRSGAVELRDTGGELLERRGEGELFGHPVRFGRSTPQYRVTAYEDSLVWLLAPETVGQLIERFPKFGEFLNADHGTRLRLQDSLGARNERLSDLGLRAPVVTSPDSSIAEAAQRMVDADVSCLPVIEEQRVAGILTDRDLRTRVVAPSLDPATPVSSVMTRDPLCVRSSLRIEEGLVEMLRRGIHHLPVIDEQGRIAGVVSAGDLMRTQSPHPVRLVRDIARAESAPAIAEIARQGPALLAGLFDSGTDVSQLGRMAGLITDACTRRLIALAERELGDPPGAYAWLAFGSQARLEQGLVSDQDNGLLLVDEPDADGERYFESLARFVCDGLNECGYVYCPGGVMAMGEWRMTARQWQRTFARWIAEPTPKSVMQSSIFFDMRAVHGDRDAAEQLHNSVLERARDSEIFRRFLAAESMTHRPPIGVFRQFVQERSGDQSRGLNLKKRGVIPIVDLARVHALESALAEVHTEERIRAAAERKRITESDADDLVHALRFIADIRLRHQVRLLRAGSKPDHLVDPDSLSGLHRRYLRSAFGIVRDAQQALAQRYQL